MRAELARVAELDVVLTERPGHATELVTERLSRRRRGGRRLLRRRRLQRGAERARGGRPDRLPARRRDERAPARARAAARSGRGGAAGRRARWPPADAPDHARPRQRPAVRLRGRRRAATPRRCGASTRSGGGDGRRPGDLAFALGDRPRARGAPGAGSSRSSRSRASAARRSPSSRTAARTPTRGASRCRSRREAEFDWPRLRRAGRGSRRSLPCECAPRPHAAVSGGATVTSAGTTSTGSRFACDRPLPLHVDGEDLGDVEQAVFEAERDAVSVLV